MKLPVSQEEMIQIFSGLGTHLKDLPEETRDELEARCMNENPWFTPFNVRTAIHGISRMLDKKDLEAWMAGFPYAASPSEIGLIMAGNIPLVGFHDFLTVLLTGNIAVLKLSSKDTVLMNHILDHLISVSPATADHFRITERLSGIDAVIATGSDNSSRYFDHYFGKYPNVIRRNRSSVAILTGKETNEELQALGQDIFTYFGLGCRNVSKLYVPAGYDFTSFFEAQQQSWEDIIHYHKYCNNYDYNKSVLLVNNERHLDNGFLLLQESAQLVSPISVLFYEYYESAADLNSRLSLHANKIQCIVGKDHIPFGEAQQPTLWDFADKKDIRLFCSQIVK